MSGQDDRKKPTGRAPQRRNEQARLAVLHAADDLLAERGYRALTIEGIAARAGVAKQTIYRWWPSKVEILLDVLEDDSEILEIPQTGSVVTDVRNHLRTLARFLTKKPEGKVLLALVGESQQDAQVAELFEERWRGPQRRAKRDVLRRGVDSGELPPNLDVDETLDRLYGPVYLRALEGRPVPRGFVDGLVEKTLGPAGSETV